MVSPDTAPILVLSMFSGSATCSPTHTGPLAPAHTGTAILACVAELQPTMNAGDGGSGNLCMAAERLDLGAEVSFIPG